ncbi:hypothetical protein [Ahrensia sp. 13_GOM-1096m]|uniref:hypothetical protein n=1 Tax=Ahrensia sp. 13_GOM-1096m TaxID=1380380 RepID=UPI00047BBCD4|nr:hypothetical protein [Ahrensia sp. 13_GOM-1096m]
MSTHTEIPQALTRYLKLSSKSANAINAYPISQSDTNQAHIDSLRTKIVSCLSCEDNCWSTDALFRIRKTVEVKLYLSEAVIGQWLILREIEEALREQSSCKTFGEHDSWSEAIKLAVDAINAHWFRHTLISNSREKVVAEAVRKTRKKGFRIPINGYGPRFPPSEYKRFCKRIEKSIARIGGENVASYILHALNKTGKVLNGYLSHARRPEMVAKKPREAGIPWHYLYSLAVKHIDSPPRLQPLEIQHEIDELINLGQLLTAIIDCEPHSSYENMALGKSSFANTMNETLIYDEMFAFPQWHPKIAAALLETWIVALDSVGILFPIVSADKWKTFAGNLLCLSDATNLIPVRSLDMIGHNLSSSECERLLSTCSSPSIGVNSSYLTPSDTAQRDASYYPVINRQNTDAVIQPTGITARSLWERLYAQLRMLSIPRLETKLGDALELLTKAVLINSGHNVTYAGEKYANPSGKGNLEADLIVETPERIFLIECKKKALTNKSRKGDTIASLTDADGSFLALMHQLARHEANLRQDGKIVFLNGSTLELNNRQIEKIGVSLSDHGSIQNRDMTIGLMQLLVGRSIDFDGKSFDNLAVSINKKLEALARNIQTIAKNSPKSGHDPVFNFAMSTWWLSIDQLAYAVDLANGNLWEGLRRVRHISTHSGDFVHDLHVCHRINPVAEGLLEASSKMNSRAMI